MVEQFAEIVKFVVGVAAWHPVCADAIRSTSTALEAKQPIFRATRWATIRASASVALFIPHRRRFLSCGVVLNLPNRHHLWPCLSHGGNFFHRR